MRLIDADTLKAVIIDIFKTEESVDKKWATGLKYSLKIIDNAPTVEPTTVYEFKGCDNCELERPKGKWKLISMGLTYKYQCSLCGRTISTTPMFLAKYPFCHCGADMRGTE